MDLQELVIQYLSIRDNKTLEQIIHQLNPFLHTKATKISKLTNVDIEDIKQELIIVLIKRLNSYDSSKSKFLTYLYNTIKGDPTGILQKMYKKRRGGSGYIPKITEKVEHKKPYFLTTESLDQAVLNGENCKTLLKDTIIDKKDVLGDIEEKDIQELIKKVGIDEAKRILKKELR